MSADNVVSNILEAQVKCAAILTTLLEVSEGSPESIIYLGIGADLNEWNILRDVLVKIGWIKVSNHYVTLTPEGKLKAEEIEKALKKG